MWFSMMVVNRAKKNDNDQYTNFSILQISKQSFAQQAAVYHENLNIILFRMKQAS